MLQIYLVYNKDDIHVYAKHSRDIKARMPKIVEDVISLD